MNFSCVSFDYQEIIRTFSIRDLSFSMYAKFSKKLHFLPLHLHSTCVYICSSEQVFLKISQYSQENTCIGVSFVLGSLYWSLKACNFIKETPTQVFSCKYREIFKNTFFDRTPLMAASRPRKESSKGHYEMKVKTVRCVLILCKIRILRAAPDGCYFNNSDSNLIDKHKLITASFSRTETFA